MVRRTLFLILAFAPLAACANTSDFRELATSTGVVVDSLRSGTDTFVANQTTLNLENARHLDDLRRQTVMPRTVARRQALAWTAAGETTTLDTYALATETDASAIVASLNTGLVRGQAVDQGETGDDYKAAHDALVELSIKPSRWDGFSSLLGFANAVQTRTAALQKAADDAATATTQATADADSSLAVAPTPAPASDPAPGGSNP